MRVAHKLFRRKVLCTKYDEKETIVAGQNTFYVSRTEEVGAAALPRRPANEIVVAEQRHARNRMGGRAPALPVCGGVVGSASHGNIRSVSKLGQKCTAQAKLA